METISIIIPAYNEEKRLSKTLSKWQNFLNPGYKVVEIIIVDDGSEDKTEEVAESFKNQLPIKIIKVIPNRGKGYAVKNGVKKALGDLIFIYDADGAVAPLEINKLLLQIKNADIVIGSRTAKGAKAKISFMRHIVGICFHIFCWPLLPKIKDASCGAKLFRKDCAKKIFEMQKIERFAFDIEILWLAKNLNLKIKEVGLEWKEIPGSKIKIFHDSLEMAVSVLSLYKRQLFNKIIK
ncbi:MAG: dolichyl-phosphate beta-glucosyltransferase [Patescibacteria group bacterium]